MSRMRRATSLPLTASAVAAVLSFGIGTAAHAAADTTSATSPAIAVTATDPIDNTQLHQNLQEPQLQSQTQPDNRQYEAATKPIDSTQLHQTLQELQLQSQMQSDNEKYTAVSNIMKTKHDTVKNSISNIR